MLFRLFAVLSLISFCTAYMTLGPASENIVDVNKPGPEPVGKPLTNAQRLAAGMLPKAPRGLENLKPTRSRHHITRTHQRRAICASPSPLVFPPRPEMTDPVTILTGVDDVSQSVSYSFDTQIFGATGSTLYVSATGVVFLGQENNVYTNEALPSSEIPPNAILPFWDDLDTRASGYAVTGQSDATSLTLRWNTYRFSDPSEGKIDFRMYYTTSQPGVWFVYYDSYEGAGDGSSAAVGAQNQDGLYTQYSYNTAFVNPGMVLAIDTSCNGGSQVIVGDTPNP